jgi:hypothetical protein
MRGKVLEDDMESRWQLVKLCHLEQIIGRIMLIGIVKKNAIMMIGFALQRERADGKAPEDSIYEGRCCASV